MAASPLRSSSRFAAAGLTLVVLLLLSTGCQPGSRIVLAQPFAPPSQRELTLTSDWAYYAIEGEQIRGLLAFPLPGSEAGPRDFLVYFSAPATPGTQTVDSSNPSGVRGFFIQVVGELRGRTDLANGSLTQRKLWYAPGIRRMDVDLRCADGTRISGRVDLHPVVSEVHAFERRHAADIALLNQTTTRPADVTDSTAPRATRLDKSP